jgi:galactose mutarotase-like enzyme
MQATFVPQLGMVGVSLRKNGEEYLDLRGGPRAFEAGHTVGLPLLHPWANRLSGDTYALGERTVDLGHLDLPRDAEGLPMHGTMLGAHEWEVARMVASGPGAHIATRYRYGRGDPKQYAAFPFPHELVVEVTVDGALTVLTSLRATSDRAVPVSFGWHPWFRIPRARRDSLTIGLPARQHVELDARHLPTGEARVETAERLSLRGRPTLDDHVVLGGGELTLETRRRRIVLEVDEGYPYAQVYAPADEPVVCLEPMTAVVDALRRDAYPLVEPGDRFDATFSVSIDS